MEYTQTILHLNSFQNTIFLEIFGSKYHSQKPDMGFLIFARGCKFMTKVDKSVILKNTLNIAHWDM